jgi:tetratricopeptide (TPR) repeat protein
MGILSALLAFALLAQTVEQSQSSAILELIQSGRFAEARSALREALKTRAKDAELWNLLGVANAQENKTAEAEQAFRRAVAIAPKLESAWLNLGRLYQLDGGDTATTGKGISAYETVLRLDPTNAEAHHQLALLLQSRGDFRGSLAHLDRLPPADSERKEALALRCAAEAALGNNGAALAAADKLLKNPQLEEEDALAILPVIEARNKKVALRLLEGLDERRMAKRSLPQLAAAYEETGDLKRARHTYERVAQGSGPSPSVLLDLARVAWKQKDYESTLGYLAHARDIEPNNAGIHFFFGVTCNEMNLPVEAKKSLEKALELAPGNPYYNYALGAVQLQWADKRQAIPYLKKFIQLRPEDARGRLALATAYFETYQQDEAKAELALPLKDPKTRAGAEYLLGRILIQQDDLDGAIAAFRRLLALQPELPEAHAELASALLDKQDLDAARREVEATLKLDRENFLANRTLLKLYQLGGDPRVKEQTALLKKLIENRDERQKRLQRTIEVRPW